MSRKAKLLRALNQVRLTMVLLGCLLALSNDAADTYSLGFPRNSKKPGAPTPGFFIGFCAPISSFVRDLVVGRRSGPQALRRNFRGRRLCRLGNSFPMPTKVEHGRGRRAVG